MIPQSRNSPPSVSPNMQILCFPVMERLVLFHYDQGSRAGAVIESLANRYNFKGYLQCDGFAGYETAFKTLSLLRQP